jgi:hypothetical protein
MSSWFRRSTPTPNAGHPSNGNGNATSTVAAAATPSPSPPPKVLIPVPLISSVVETKNAFTMALAVPLRSITKIVVTHTHDHGHGHGHGQAALLATPLPPDSYSVCSLIATFLELPSICTLSRVSLHTRMVIFLTFVSKYNWICYVWCLLCCLDPIYSWPLIIQFGVYLHVIDGMN